MTVPPTTEPQPTEPATTQPPTTEPPTTKPNVVAGRVGDQVTVYEFGDAQFEVTVTKVKFSTGDEIERPEHGLFMGAYVQVHALTDWVWAAEMSALVGGERYGEVLSALRTFDPPLEYVLLDNGERAAGWLVFDVPAQHGQLVLRDMDKRQLAVWNY